MADSASSASTPFADTFRRLPELAAKVTNPNMLFASATRFPFDKLSEHEKPLAN